MSQTSINKPVSVTALGFRGSRPAYPRRIEYEGKSYTFVDVGISCSVRRGGHFATIFTMTDGLKQFRIRSDNKSNSWTLMSMCAA